MREQRIIRTTLGELVVAVTDEVTPLMAEASGAYGVVSCIVSDLLVQHQERVRKGSRRDAPRSANALKQEKIRSGSER